ncbi:hydrogenase expression/formation protein [Rhodoblastus sphagnicola]|uniref:Hydrogenase expression/formation protein n=1 Tax=Rhodoblastus sphagnicola TaxID=333368 RepID=A0A2S6N5A6_9HYPH|nr:hydrogenase expression/formation protein [Rhodoblastus sphagnicola]MBB4197167.1 hydrogenase-1 operon protein HyaF [Rhodoblastus sphagnicola]PPQ29782.1 hydrogenase expression/formation protein [Rhodoblastus sphagnicola]
MKAGFWVAPEGADEAMTILPIGVEEDTQARRISLLATGEGEALAKACPRVRDMLPKIVAALENQKAGAPGQLFDLTEFSADEKRLLSEAIGDGEVGGVASTPDGVVAQIQEANMAGLWRVRFTAADGQLFADYLEVSALPEIARRAALVNGRPLTIGAPPEGAMNVMPLLQEISARSEAWKEGDPTHTITFSLLPMNPVDMSFLQQNLGPGSVKLISKGYGACRVHSTGAKHVWSVQYFNASDEIVLDTLEIGAPPAAACAADEDFIDSAERLREIEEAYFA